MRFHIGLRTVKTAVAVLIAMVLVGVYGTSDSKLTFAMLGAMTAMKPTFWESLSASIAQMVGVFFGALLGVALMQLPVPVLVKAGVGIVLVIALYNMLRVPFAPDLPCMIVVLLCITPDIQPFVYATGRLWDTFIGLTIGMLVNVLVFPYDNSRRIRDTVQSLDREVILFLEELFDGDDRIPDADSVEEKIDYLESQLEILKNQKPILRLRRRKINLETYRRCEKKARQLAVQMEILYQMGRPGMLTEENRNRLAACGATLWEDHNDREPDVVTNYHVQQILTLRQELLDVLENK